MCWHVNTPITTCLHNRLDLLCINIEISIVICNITIKWNYAWGMITFIFVTHITFSFHELSLRIIYFFKCAIFLLHSNHNQICADNMLVYLIIKFLQSMNPCFSESIFSCDGWRVMLVKVRPQNTSITLSHFQVSYSPVCRFTQPDEIYIGTCCPGLQVFRHYGDAVLQYSKTLLPAIYQVFSTVNPQSDHPLKIAQSGTSPLTGKPNTWNRCFFTKSQTPWFNTKTLIL